MSPSGVRLFSFLSGKPLAGQEIAFELESRATRGSSEKVQNLCHAAGRDVSEARRIGAPDCRHKTEMPIFPVRLPTLCRLRQYTYLN